MFIVRDLLTNRPAPAGRDVSPRKSLGLGDSEHHAPLGLNEVLWRLSYYKHRAPPGLGTDTSACARMRVTCSVRCRFHCPRDLLSISSNHTPAASTA